MNPLILLLGLVGMAGALAGGGGKDESSASASEDETSVDEARVVPEVTIVVYDSDYNIVRTVSEGESLDFGTEDTSGYSIGAVVEANSGKSAKFNSVVLEVNGQAYTQNAAPYNTPSGAVDLTDGSYTITVKVYSGQDGTGKTLTSESLSFNTTATVVEVNVVTPERPIILRNRVQLTESPEAGALSPSSSSSSFNSASSSKLFSLSSAVSTSR